MHIHTYSRTVNTDTYRYTHNNCEHRHIQTHKDYTHSRTVNTDTYRHTHTTTVNTHTYNVGSTFAVIDRQESVSRKPDVWSDKVLSNGHTGLNNAKACSQEVLLCKALSTDHWPSLATPSRLRAALGPATCLQKICKKATSWLFYR